MADKNTSVFGIYTDTANAERAVEALRLLAFQTTTFPPYFLTSKGKSFFRLTLPCRARYAESESS